ncbi:MAG: nucleotidyltransferase family protein [Ruminococcaceae bacterium]|nr:nucleotidyltransferase family protein [Oscillospiraceae bacterium]
MKICAVISEYNPFHRGHLEQIEFIKANYPDTVIASIMSGNIVQRGELAVLDKYKRAEAAVRCGADLVLELPYPYSCSSAGYFARAGVYLADSIGADMLCFGSESGDIGLLSRVAKRTLTDEYINRLETLLSKGKSSAESYISLYRKAYSELYGEEIPDGSNNTLAIEYLRAIYALDSSVTPITNKRTSPYSAAASRYFYKKKDKELFVQTPERLHSLYESEEACDTQSIEGIVLWHLANSDPEELSRYADVDTGIASRLISCAAKSRSLHELYSNAATKKYTDSRVRRAVFNCLFCVKKQDLEAPPSYTLLLCANRAGCAALKEIKKRSDIAIITKPADYKACGEAAAAAFGISLKADTLFAIARGEKPEDILKRSPVIIK